MLYGKPIQLSKQEDNKNKPPEFRKKVFQKAIKKVHENKEFTADMLEDKEVVDVIRETYKVLNHGIDHAIAQEVPTELTTALKENTFIFSGFKTYHLLKEASLLLTDEKGGFKPFYKFERDVLKVHNAYNRNYLNAEYNYAVQATQMAVKWQTELSQATDRYNLQFRTAGDEKVRDSHATLHNTTLPADDPFWDNYLPPLGWNCRCTTVRVLKGKYELSDSKEKIKLAEQTTDTPKLRIFRFNPGKIMKLFPPKHPYFPKGCEGCGLKLARQFPASEKCKACKIIEALKNKEQRKSKKQEVKDLEIKTKKVYKGLIETKLFKNVYITNKSIEKSLNKNRGNYDTQKEILKEFKNIDKYIKEYRGTIELLPPNSSTKQKKKPNIVGYVNFRTKNGKFEICLEKDIAFSRNDYKLYYIEKVKDLKGKID